ELCWDQTGLCRLLQSEEGLGRAFQPLFSWAGGPRHKAVGGSSPHLFVLDCGAFNFKYVNNCDFVFHAVGEKELLYSFARTLSLKSERLYSAVQEGFVCGGQCFDSLLPLACKHLPADDASRARAKLE
ncbi:unnamed protein product, partial [Polarella glacialis]